MSRRDPSLSDGRLADRRLVNVAWAGVAALLAIGVLLAARSELDDRSRATRAAEVQADILAASVSAALSFDDRAAMREYLGALQVNRAVAAAAVYDARGQAVVVFHRPDAPSPPARAPAPGARFVERHVAVTRGVAEQGARLGAVYLETRPESWASILGRHSNLGVMTILAFLLLGVVTAAASQLQHRARLLSAANARLLEEMAARGEAEEALRQSQKMEALGQLTGGIAHDFNNLLQVVHGAFELIRRRPDDTDKVAAWSENGIAAAERGASLTRQLLAFSRSQKLELRPFVVADLIAEMHDLLVRTLGPDIVLAVALDETRAAVMSDRTQLELAVLNLAINARDAMPDGGRLTISTTIRAIGPGDPVLEPGDYVDLSVADTGDGMAPEVIERAFDPFFTTKGVGKGTGLGLSQVYGVARQAGGVARIASTPGGGTVVSLLLRHSTATAEAGAEPDESLPILAPEGGHTVLVVDDEDAVRTLACETLKLLGYRVLEADSGAAALEVLATACPDLMLFDYAMPAMNGAELARVARLRCPGVPIVFASGYADTDQVEAAVGGEATILRKPFNMETLARTVSTLLRDAGKAGT
ncbi:MAG TPA: response regulator [Phenylobacterium sp.]|jgi:signal transduction histidine kinase/ActR/RegA family two-component response regulator|uniref:response regulator n=1 Tax=Phenylobacterium sp. TaxID=1871053 RepID=UPI002C75877B|nr:response regulator [Phenylobacterium sp.]HXA39000.1 response regulator [Phenylobacterium sp.]